MKIREWSDIDITLMFFIGFFFAAEVLLVVFCICLQLEKIKLLLDDKDEFGEGRLIDYVRDIVIDPYFNSNKSLFDFKWIYKFIIDHAMSLDKDLLDSGLIPEEAYLKSVLKFNLVCHCP